MDIYKTATIGAWQGRKIAIDFDQNFATHRLNIIPVCCKINLVEEEMRIINHPVLGEIEKGKEIKFFMDGIAFKGYQGEPIAAALRACGVLTHRHTIKNNEPRGIFCAIGKCTDCVMIVDGKPNIRTCVTPLKEGMKIETQYGIKAKK